MADRKKSRSRCRREGMAKGTTTQINKEKQIRPGSVWWYGIHTWNSQIVGIDADALPQPTYVNPQRGQPLASKSRPRVSGAAGLVQGGRDATQACQGCKSRLLLSVFFRRTRIRRVAPAAAAAKYPLKTTGDC